MDYTAIFQNCMDVRQDGKAYFPTRFSDLTAGYFMNVNKRIGMRARCTASIKMSFYTQQETISFSYYVGYLAKKRIQFDIYENGQLLFSHKEPLGTTSGTVTYRKQHSGESLLTIFLPPLCETWITKLDIGEFRPAPTPKNTCMLLGDSITQGVFSLYPSMTYATQLGETLGMRIINQGVSGYVFDKNTLMDVKDVKPDVIFVAYGTNDFVKEPLLDTIALNVSLYMQTLSGVKGDANVYVITPIWRMDGCEIEPAMERFQKVREIIAAEAEKAGFYVIDGFRLVPHNTIFYNDKFLHPNEFGFSQYTLNLLRELSAINGYFFL